MQWSKLKQLLAERMAPSVKDRVELHCARYRHASDGDGRCWITLDGREIADFCSFRAAAAQGRLAEQLRTVTESTNYRDPTQQAGYYAAGDQAADIVHKQGFYTQFEFYDAMEEYLSLSIEDALASPKLPIRALAVLDRRVGKRRLRSLHLSGDEHSFVRELVTFRRGVEGVQVTPSEA